MAVLTLNDLKKSYTQGSARVDVLMGVSLTVEPGEVVALTGASGSGKSTLLQVAGLLDTPSDGEISIGGQRVDAEDENQRTSLRRGSIGFVYQFHHLLPDFTALENVALVRRIMGDGDRSARNAAKDLLVQMGLEHRLDHTPGQLSGGEQQRVAIARALVGGAGLLLADEPTGNLDDDTTTAVFEVLKKVAKERNVGALIATHDRSLAARMDRVLEIKKGRLVGD